MKACAGNVLQSARNAAGLYQYQVAQLIGFRTNEAISEDTIGHWENNRVLPDPEQVSILEEVYRQPGMWDAWMRQQYPSYRQRIPKRANVSNPALAVVQAGYEMQDVAKLTEPLGRDLMDGKLDDPVLKQEYISQVNQALSALTAAVTLLGGGKHNEGLQGI